MDRSETAALTEAMLQSGDTLDLAHLKVPRVDKHSMGGVGDKVSLILAPLVASCGAAVPQLSGRGLGHTGGTLDKLEAIPGFNVTLPIDRFIGQVKEIGMAIGGQTQELAPADGKIYALRDVTATVESIPLIAASVVSKKIAAGANMIILDVKCGRGAFMDTEAKAKELAQVMTDVGHRLNRPIMCTVTDMEQPLGMAVGHTVEVIEAVNTLKGNGPPDLEELCLTLGSLALVTAKKCATEHEARKKLQEIIDSGKALENLRTLIKAQGGDPSVIENPGIMPTAKLQLEYIPAAVSGTRWVKHLDGRKVSEACKLMGAGRDKKNDPINHAVGIVLCAKVGSKLEPGQAAAIIHADTREHFEAAARKLDEAFTFSSDTVATPTLIKASAH
jgi:pyrimidine-nucleoside phosphorylase